MLLSNIESGLSRELQAILTLYLATVMGGFMMGFSAIAIPDIKNEIANCVNSTDDVTDINDSECDSLIPVTMATGEQLSWFGTYSFISDKLCNLSLLQDSGMSNHGIHAICQESLSWLCLDTSKNVGPLLVGMPQVIQVH